MKNRILSLYDYFLIVGIIASNLIYSLLTEDVDILGSIVGIAGVICVVLVAKGSIWNYLFGIVNVSMYAYISYKTEIYGDAVLNAFYYFPMQFIGWWQWSKRDAASSAGSNLQIKARRLNWKKRVLIFCVCVLSIIAVAYILRIYGDPQPLKDSTTTVLSIVAQALMALAYMEQWVLWIITNVVSVIMWSIEVAKGETHASAMLIMWIFYLLNSINGLRVWLKLSRGSR